MCIRDSYRESEIALVALGSMVKTAEKVHAALREEGIPASLDVYKRQALRSLDRRIFQMKHGKSD